MNDFINLLLMRSLVTSALKRVLQAFLPTCYISATNGSNHSTDTVNVSKSSQYTSIWSNVMLIHIIYSKPGKTIGTLTYVLS